MRCVLFYHAFSSCWNNGNAHFLRGIARELNELGHEVIVYEPADGWSLLNALNAGGAEAIDEVKQLFSRIDLRQYQQNFDAEEAIEGADLVIMHEWNSPELIAQIGRRRLQGAQFTLLFHDTHHRAVSAPEELARFVLGGFDGVLAFGEVLRQIYLRLGWTSRAFTWHEAADTRLYRPLPHVERTHDVVWIGNWGDGERAVELNEFLVRPVAELGLRARIHGVRYSEQALQAIEAAGIEYRGWLPAHRAPAAFAAAHATLHVPRGPYAKSLPGIPTIRMFEAMACGIPAVSAPWDDCEHLFPEGCYLRAGNGKQMKQALRALLGEADLASGIADAARRAIAAHHTCRHRALQLLDIVQEIQGTRPLPLPGAYEGARP